ncbi:MAG: SDR family oxidoreductase, partial [Chloroflexi bacterium]|nr:SDR family oxidoreductase [Chloroflexota bacterium]
MFRLDGKSAIVTGAGSGIGREIALLFAQQGAQVVVTDVRPEAADAVVKEIGDSTGAAYRQNLDVTNEAQVKQAIQETVRHYGRLDIIVNNAGISHVGNILETSAEDFDRVMNVNTRGVFLCSKYAVEQMVAQNPTGGIIVNIASVAGMIAIDRRLAYSTSKGAVMSITRSVAMDFVTQGIRANAICPGTVHTPFVEGYLERYFADNKDEVRRQLHARQPVGRMGRPDEIASAALYLASEEA